MKSWQFAVVALVASMLAGCRAQRRLEIDLLERQNRLLEDEIYRLRECLPDDQKPIQPWPDARTPAPGQSAPLPPPVSELGEPAGEDELPELMERYKDSTAPSDENLPGPAPSNGSEGNGQTDGPPTGTQGPMIQIDSSRVTQLVLNQELTGGYNSDGRPGDEGIMVVIEPRDAGGRRVEAPAAVSAVVLDPALESEAARVARWDFSAAETAETLFNSDLGRGIGLQLDWPAGPPDHEQLHLFVRYTTSEGRHVEADQPIRIELPEERTAGWVPSQHPAPGRQASRPTHPQQFSPRPAVQPSPLPEPVAAAPPADPAFQRPVWSPDRR